MKKLIAGSIIFLPIIGCSGLGDWQPGPAVNIYDPTNDYSPYNPYAQRIWSSPYGGGEMLGWTVPRAGGGFSIFNMAT